VKVLSLIPDAPFAVHADFKSHTGSVMSLGKGAITTLSRKQKLNTKSSTTAELVGADDVSTMILWTKLFMKEQGYPIKETFCTRITRVQFYWKKMAERVQENNLER